MVEDKDNPMLNHSSNLSIENNQQQTTNKKNLFLKFKNKFNFNKIKLYFKFATIGGTSKFKDENDGMKSGPEIGIKIDF